MLDKLIVQAQERNTDAIQKLIKQFLPLIKKYAYRLHYEDAEHDLLLFFLELIYKIPSTLLSENNDGKIVNYISISIKNHFNHLVSQKLKLNNTIHLSCLSQEQQHLLEEKSATTDNHDYLLLDVLKEILNDKEFEIIYLRYYKQYSISEIADMKNKTRQAVNQMHLRTLKKLSETLT